MTREGHYLLMGDNQESVSGTFALVKTKITILSNPTLINPTSLNQYKDGEKDGIWRINHEDTSDKLWKKQTWKDDKIVSGKCWDRNGIEIECD